MTHQAMVVGNDVVDLSAGRTRGKSRDERFLQRILDPIERAYVATSSDPDVTLWSLWAAKETAYKIASKVRGEPPVFEHAAFGVRWNDPETSDQGVSAGTVQWQDVEAVVLVTRQSPNVLHAVGHARMLRRPDAREGMETIGVGVARWDDPHGRWGEPEEVLRKRLTPREADAVYSQPSAAVRLAARESLAAALGVEEARLEIICAPGDRGRRPPWVFLDGEPARADVSLSHDGPWLGWAWSAG